MLDDALEYVILSKKECFAYSVPESGLSVGFKASDWSECVWKGRLQVCSKGESLIIKLLENSGVIFVACPIDRSVPLNSFVERAADSSRYFVLKVSDNRSRKSFIGFGFDNRNDAFDFNACLQDFYFRSNARSKPISHVSISNQEVIKINLSTEREQQHQESQLGDFDFEFGSFTNSKTH